jgi:hypothetical protein
MLALVVRPQTQELLPLILRDDVRHILFNPLAKVLWQLIWLYGVKRWRQYQPGKTHH